MMTTATNSVIADVVSERVRQNTKWGVQRHQYGDWIAILGEEFGEASQAAVEYIFGRHASTDDLRKELVQVAAVAVQIIEQIDEQEQR